MVHQKHDRNRSVARGTHYRFLPGIVSDDQPHPRLDLDEPYDGSFSPLLK